LDGRTLLGGDGEDAGIVRFMRHVETGLGAAAVLIEVLPAVVAAGHQPGELTDHPAEIRALEGAPQTAGAVAVNVGVAKQKVGNARAAAPGNDSGEAGIVVASGDDGVDLMFAEPADDLAGLSPRAKPAAASFLIADRLAAAEDDRADLLGQRRGPRLPVVFVQEDRRQLHLVSQLPCNSQVLVNAVGRRAVRDDRQRDLTTGRHHGFGLTTENTEITEGYQLSNSEGLL
jgi:hypothetical protein